MKILNMKIKRCYNCPYYLEFRVSQVQLLIEMECKKMGLKGKWKDIPSWCPLPDEEEKKK